MQFIRINNQYDGKLTVGVFFSSLMAWTLVFLGIKLDANI